VISLLLSLLFKVKCLSKETEREFTTIYNNFFQNSNILPYILHERPVNYVFSTKAQLEVGDLITVIILSIQHSSIHYVPYLRSFVLFNRIVKDGIHFIYFL